MQESGDTETFLTVKFIDEKINGRIIVIKYSCLKCLEIVADDGLKSFPCCVTASTCFFFLYSFKVFDVSCLK